VLETLRKAGLYRFAWPLGRRRRTAARPTMPIPARAPTDPTGAPRDRREQNPPPA